MVNDHGQQPELDMLTLPSQHWDSETTVFADCLAVAVPHFTVPIIPKKSLENL